MFRNTQLDYKLPENFDATTATQPIKVSFEITPLELACFTSHLEMAKKILAIPEAAATITDNALMYTLDACQRDKKAYEIAELLLEYKPNTSSQQIKNYLKDKMLSAVDQGNIDLVLLLIKLDPTLVNITDDANKTPLAHALERTASPNDNFMRIILILIEHNAHPQHESVVKIRQQRTSDKNLLLLLEALKPLSELARDDKSVLHNRLAGYYSLLCALDNKPNKADQEKQLYFALLAAENANVSSRPAILLPVGGLTKDVEALFNKSKITVPLWSTQYPYGLINRTDQASQLQALYWLERYHNATDIIDLLPIVETFTTEAYSPLVRLCAVFIKCRFFMYSTKDNVAHSYENSYKALQHAAALFKANASDNDFRKKTLIALLLIKAELLFQSGQKQKSIECFAEAVNTGDLLITQRAVSYATAANPSHPAIPYFYAKAIDAAKYCKYDVLADKLENLRQDFLKSNPAVKLENDAKSEEKSADKLKDINVEDLFAEVDDMLKNKKIQTADILKIKKIEPELSNVKRFSELFMLFQANGEDEATFDLFAKKAEMLMQTNNLNNIIEANPPASKLRLFVIAKAPSYYEIVENQPDCYYPSYIKMVYMHCFTDIPFLKIPAEQRIEKLKYAEKIVEYALSYELKQKLIDRIIDLSAKLHAIRQELAKVTQANQQQNVVLLEEKTNLLIKAKIELLFIPTIKENKPAEAIQGFFTLLHSTKPQEQKELVHCFITEKLAELIQGHDFYKLIPSFFATNPALTAFRKEMIEAIKNQLANQPDCSFQLGMLLSETCTTANAELKENTEQELEASYAKQIQLFYLAAKSSPVAANRKLALEQLGKISRLNLLSPGLIQEAKSKLVYLDYTLYSQTPDAKDSESHRNKLRQFAKIGVPQAIFQLQEWYSPENGKRNKGVNLGVTKFGFKEFVGRRLYLCAKLCLLNPEIMRENFPELKDHAELTMLLPARRLLEAWRERNNNKDENEYSVMARWYLSLREKMQAPKTAIDLEMKNLLNKDVDVFLLKAAEIYTGNFSETEKTIIKKRIEQDMKNAYDDSQFVKEKVLIAKNTLLAMSVVADAKVDLLQTKTPPVKREASAPASSAAPVSKMYPSLEEKNPADSKAGESSGVTPHSAAKFRPAPPAAIVSQIDSTLNALYFAGLEAVMLDADSFKQSNCRQTLVEWSGKNISPENDSFICKKIAAYYLMLAESVLPIIRDNSNLNLFDFAVIKAFKTNDFPAFIASISKPDSIQVMNTLLNEHFDSGLINSAIMRGKSYKVQVQASALDIPGLFA